VAFEVSGELPYFASNQELDLPCLLCNIQPGASGYASLVRPIISNTNSINCLCSGSLLDNFQLAFMLRAGYNYIIFDFANLTLPFYSIWYVSSDEVKNLQSSHFWQQVTECKLLNLFSCDLVTGKRNERWKSFSL
jgi:hypothetical protein